MPRTHIHFGINLIIYYISSLIFSIEFLIINLLYILLAELIDLDHLIATKITRPFNFKNLKSKHIYYKKANPFKIRFFHIHWKIVSLLAIISLPFYPLTFFGLALMSHLIVDYTYTKHILKI